MPFNPAFMGILIPIIGLMIGAFVVFSKSDIGRALADRIRGGARDTSELAEQIEALRSDVEAMRSQLAETQERLDFTERLLAEPRSEPS